MRFSGTRTAALALALWMVQAMGGTSPAVPAVTRMAGDVPGSPGRNYPFFATDVVLSHHGYVEEEFFFEGRANTYATAANATAATAAGAGPAAVTSTGTPYRSRLLVRRPLRQARFNGVVLVEWLNVTNGYDTDVLWLYQKEYLLREGYAWIGVSAQNVGVSRPPHGLKVWSPARYGTLDIDAGGKITGDALGYDIYSQAGAAVRQVPAVLGGLKPAWVVAAGQSQSAGRLVTYLNAVHPRTPVYDAALLTVNAGTIRTDLDLPIIKVLSENEANASRNQPDSTRVRTWTVAGATHSEQYSLISRAAFLRRDLNLPAVDACETPARSRVEIRYVYNAALASLVRWIGSGRPAPAAPPLTFEGDVLQRDRHGNALGGIRLAEIAVPVAREAAGACGLGGIHVPFETATLDELYPTHDSYVARVRAASDALVDAGFLTAADAALTADRARRSIYGRGLECGPLCADVRQFPSHPSSTLLARQTAALLIKDGDALVRLLDDVTTAIAQGYTMKDAAAADRKFAQAVAGVQQYRDRLADFARRRHLAPETAALLDEQAATLQARLSSRDRP